MSVRDFGELSSETQRVVEEYLTALEAGFCQVTRNVARDALDETRSHVLEALDSDATPDTARVVLSELGEPDEYARALCGAIRGDATPVGRVPDEGEHALAQPAMRIFGMPADLKAPTRENLQSRMWNPHDPRIFTPRLIGLGWTINFAALGVRLGILRPDDEDVPFASTPQGWLWSALALPVLITLLASIALSVMWGSLPTELPVHWGFSGSPDGFASKAVATVPLLVVMLGATGYSIWAFGAGKSRAARAVILAFSTMFVLLLGAILGVSVAYGRGIELNGAWPLGMLLVALGVPFLELVALSRLGRIEEMRRDFENSGGMDAHGR